MNKYDETTRNGSRSLIHGRILYTARVGHVCKDPAEGWKSNCGECLSFHHHARRVQHNIIGMRVYVYILYTTVVGHNIILFDSYTAARIVLRVLDCVYIVPLYRIILLLYLISLKTSISRRTKRGHYIIIIVSSTL